MPVYVHRTALKRALQIDASATGRNAELDEVAEAVSRLFDEHVGFSFGPSSGTRDFTARNGDRLYLGTPLLAVDALRTDSSGNASYGTTIATNGYYLAPYNATLESPRAPYWEIQIRDNTTASGAFFPKNQRGVRVVGRWGYYDERASSTATLATDVSSNTTTIQLNGATSLHPGQTVLMGAERMLVTQTPGSATGAHTSGISVRRGMDGTSGATHSSATGIDVYSYPIVDRLALHQAQFDFRAQDAPLGFTGGVEGGQQRPVMAGGLHPFVQRRLDRFRTPEVG